MAFAILGALLVLVVIGLVVAVATAVRTRRELDDLEEEFAEHRGVALGPEPDTPPWSSFDLDDLRVDPTEVAGHDPYATLTNANSEVTWHAASGNGPEADPNGTGSSGTSDPELVADLAPIADLRPVAWRPTVDAPVIVLVVGAGFLGTGMTASMTTADRLRRRWSEVNDSFAQAGVITLEPDAESAAQQSYDDGLTRDDLAVADPPSWPRARRPGVESFAPTEDEEGDALFGAPQRSHQSRPEPTAGPERIAWRAPPTRRR